MPFNLETSDCGYCRRRRPGSLRRESFFGDKFDGARKTGGVFRMEMRVRQGVNINRAIASSVWFSRYPAGALFSGPLDR